ncbi:MAG: hypothetical protein K2Q26_01940 [Bdellovibrionales bacterium]|nr:hypothetical protein [Bdellovibrionales bacterium]
MFGRSLGIATVVGVTVLVTVGCSNNSPSDSAPMSLAGSEGGAIQKVSLSSATEADIVQHKVSCHGKSKHLICIQVCHRPPGNPSQWKEMILPLKATMAHLKHGGPHHDQHDFLGLCEDSPADDESGGDDGSGSVPDSGGGSGETGGDSPDDGGDVSTLPIWCERNLAIDADCDGFNDQTGESIY